MTDFITSHAAYLRHASRSTTAEIVEHAKQALQGVDYDSLVGIGLSGALVVPIIGRALDKHWLVLRKDSESTHASSSLGEGTLGKRWVFVDDLVDSGETRDNVRQKVDSLLDERAPRSRHGIAFSTEYVGDYLYHARNYGDEPWTEGGVYRPFNFHGFKGRRPPCEEVASGRRRSAMLEPTPGFTVISSDGREA
jgi:hypothetical protein